jgi:hypothetical protein
LNHRSVIGIFTFYLGIDGNANRRRRRRRQISAPSGSTNAYLGASAPAGYNYPADTNIKGIRLNNPDARDLYGNPYMSSSNRDNTLTSVDLNDQPRPQQQQIYGTNDQSLLNALYSGGSFYGGGGGGIHLKKTTKILFFFLYLRISWFFVLFIKSYNGLSTTFKSSFS